jgi:hypothetical protein
LKIADEAIPSSSECFNENGRFRRFAQYVAQPFYGCIQTVIKIDKGIRRPKLATQFLSRDDFSGPAVHDTYGGKSHIERRWGTTFVNVAGLTAYMGKPVNCNRRSWLLTLKNGSDELNAQCYMHASDYAPQGWYPKFDRVIKLSKPFKLPEQ